MAEASVNLWAPWRMEYIRSLGGENPDDGCFLCRYWATPEDDRTNRVVWRTANAFVCLNRFPYSNGHLLIAHAAHKGELTDLNDAEIGELAVAQRDAMEALRRAVRPEGFNVGYNLGRCAGAGLPGHVHAHVVPRWSGDTNFMAVIGDVRVIPDALDALYRDLHGVAQGMGLRT